MNEKEDYKFHVKRERPEDIYKNATDYFNEKKVRAYATSKSMMRIQLKITQRALELLRINDSDSIILDAGCGPGYSSFLLKELGYRVVAIDLISDFFNYYNLKEFYPVQCDMSVTPFRPNCFDGIISISALQWLTNDLRNKKRIKRIRVLMKRFYTILKPDSNLIFQFYPKDNQVLEKLKEIVLSNTNFDGGFIIDNPKNPKKRKIFLELHKNR
ncbi:MAG: methyltransferase domain-containing protein [Candidatus Lokiarchaeota archaeon]|nr:methyltransferase domain-containing protein [Candidatus Lokiarchaeota archaeon]MBD3200398.1 methyltransferase domain-containing protein [Candidatus Lokiarchaeota archaeon]